MSEKKQDTESTGFAAKLKKMMCGCGGGCCCGDVKIVPKEEAQDKGEE